MIIVYKNDQLLVIIVILRMGNQKSLYDSSITRIKNNEDWNVIAHYETYQLWEHKTQRTKYMAYQIDHSQIDSQQKKQLYHFRKINCRNLVNIQAIISDQTAFLCGQPKQNYLLVQNIPYRLNSFNKCFDFREAIIILSAAMSAYKLLYHIYGPLYTSERMIGFNEKGQTKIWINDIFSSNQPSKVALGVTNAALNVNSGQDIQQKTKLCVKRLFQTVELSTKSEFPIKFRQQIDQIRNFQEGQQFMNALYRRMGINTNEVISLQKNNSFQIPILYETKDISFYQKKNSEINHSGIFNEQFFGKRRNINITFQKPIEAKAKMFPIIPVTDQNILYNQNKSSLTSSIHNIHMNQVNKPVVYHHRNASGSIILIPSGCNSPFISNQRIATTCKLGSLQRINSKYQEKQNNPQKFQFISQNKQTLDYQSWKILGTHASTQEALKSRQEISFKNLNKNHQRSQSDQQYQLIVHQIISSSQSNQTIQKEQSEKSQSEQQSDADYIPQTPKDRLGTKQFSSFQQPQDEIKRWQQSLSRYSIKKQKQKGNDKNQQNLSSQDRYLSQERDKVYVQQIITKQPSNQNTIDDLQSYIRKKYSSYLEKSHTNQQKLSNQQNYNEIISSKLPLFRLVQTHTQFYNYNLISKQEIQSYKPNDGSISQIPSQQDCNRNVYDLQQRKYTFGKIQLDPFKAKNQYYKALTKQQSKNSFTYQGSSQRFINTNRSQNFQNKYQKYVKNKGKIPKISLQSKDISSIMKFEESVRLATKRQFLLNEFIHNSNNPLQKQKAFQGSDILISGEQNKERQMQLGKNSDQDIKQTINMKNTLTYDLLRQFLWA